MQNHFELFQLEPGFDVDLAQLESAYREIQARVHPDRFVNAGSTEQRIAMQWATRANEAYQTLKNPLKRASYLCELNGVALQAESNTAMPAEFLMQQMEWREELEQARDQPEVLLELEKAVQQSRRDQAGKIAEQMKQKNYPQAAQLIRQWMFLEKFANEVYNRISAAHG